VTVEEILAALQAIVDEATAAAAEGEQPEMTPEQTERYEALERQLAARQRSDGVLQRNAALQGVDQRQRVPAGAGGRRATNERADELTRAFLAYVRTGQVNQDIVQLRAQGEGVGDQGGFLVPDGFRDRLVQRMVAFGGIAGDVEDINTTTGNPLPWPTLDDTANLGEVVNEGGTFSSGADMVFGSESLGAYRYMAGGGSSLPLRVSVELAQDSAFDIEGLVSRVLGERIGRIQARHWVRGTGVNEPKGIVQGRTGIEIAADGSGITYDDLVHFIHSVDPAYREGGRCRWAFNDASLERIKKIKDSHGDPIWRQDNADMGTDTGGGQLMGYPVRVDQAFADFSAADNTVNWGVFGDLQEGYVIRRVREVVLVVNPWTRASNGQIEYTAWARADGTIQNPNAYVALTGET
jgi:HK97 family phage major capsid protein